MALAKAILAGEQGVLCVAMGVVWIHGYCGKSSGQATNGLQTLERLAMEGIENNASALVKGGMSVDVRINETTNMK